MKTIAIEVPDELEMPEDDIKLFLAVKLYEAQKMSLGNCAFIAGLTKRTFLELLGKYGVSLFNHSSENVLEDLQNAETHLN